MVADRTPASPAHDLVVLVAVVPAQVPGLLALVRATRGGHGAPPGSEAGTGRPRVVVLAHNVVPHETHPGGRWLMERLLHAADGVLVHSADQERLARDHGARDVVVADLPPHLPGGVPDPGRRAEVVAARRSRATARDADPSAVLRVLALGYVRRYKGVDLLLAAAADVPAVAVTVAGEIWPAAGRDLDVVRGDPRLAGRVDVRPGYVAADTVPDLLAEHDVLALPYRHATASQNVLLAHAHGLPVLATRVGTFAEQVRDGVDGVLVAADGAAALADGLRRLLEPGVFDALCGAVPDVDDETPWKRYVDALTTVGAG